MSGLPIPNDWTEATDGYCWLVAKVPNSPMWRAMARGALWSLSFWYKWDKQTGDQDTAAAVAGNIFDTVELRKTLGHELQFIAHLSFQQSVPGPLTDSLWELDVTEFDPEGQFDVTNHKWIVPNDGIYIIGAWVQFWNMSGSDNFARVRCRKVGDSEHLINSGNVRQSPDDYVHGGFESPVHLSSGDEIQWYVSHSNSSNRLTSSYTATQRAWAWKVG